MTYGLDETNNDIALKTQARQRIEEFDRITKERPPSTNEILRSAYELRRLLLYYTEFHDQSLHIVKTQQLNWEIFNKTVESDPNLSHQWKQIRVAMQLMGKEAVDEKAENIKKELKAKYSKIL